MAPISMKTKTSGPLSPGTSASGGMRNSGFMGGTASGTVMTGSSKGGGGSKSTSSTDILNDLKKEMSRREFFKGRQDVSDDRLLRRYLQDEKLRKYKQDLVRQGKYVTDSQGNPVRTASGDYVYTGTATFDTDSSSPTFGQYVTYGVNDKMQDLARQYGPTFREIGSDIGYAVGSMGKGLGQFIGKGGVIGNVLSGLYDKFKGGTQEGIETVKGLYDNLRTTLSGQPTVNYGGGSTITTTTNQPAVDLTPASIDTEELPAMNLSRNVGDESDPSIFGIDNAGVPLPYERSTPIVPEYYDPNNTLGNIYLESIGVVPEGTINSDLRTEISPEDKRRMLDQYIFDKMIREEINRNKQQKINRDMQMYQTDPTGRHVLMAENVGLPSLMDLYEFAANPEVSTPVGSLRFDNVLSGNPQLGYSNTVDIFGQPVDVTATIGNQGLNVGGSFTFKNGGSVDKYAGLGYKLK